VTFAAPALEALHVLGSVKVLEATAEEILGIVGAGLGAAWLRVCLSRRKKIY
jgi:hypothetical protein